MELRDWLFFALFLLALVQLGAYQSAKSDSYALEAANTEIMRQNVQLKGQFEIMQQDRDRITLEFMVLEEEGIDKEMRLDSLEKRTENYETIIKNIVERSDDGDSLYPFFSKYKLRVTPGAMDRN